MMKKINTKNMIHRVTHIGLVAALLTIVSTVSAQQEVLISQYMFNGQFINPAYSGSHPYWEATALHRSQWVSFDGAPTTQLLEVDGPIVNGKMGMGFVVLHDKIGDTEQFEFSVNPSYHLDLDESKNHRLSFGIRAGFTNYSFRGDQTEVFESDDQVFQDQVKNEYVPKFGAGVYYYSERSYVGISVPTLFAGDGELAFKVISDSLRTPNADEIYFENHTFINAGHVFDISPAVKLKPNVLVKYHPAAPLQVDINANALLYDKLWVGVSYRTAKALIGLIEYNITEQLRVGYAYDFTFSDISDYSSGSHEIMLGYSFGKDVIKMRSPRYF